MDRIKTSLFDISFLKELDPRNWIVKLSLLKEEALFFI